MIPWIMLENMFNEADCRTVIDAINDAKLSKYQSKAMNLLEGDDRTNTLYSSERSPLNYCYLDTPKVKEFNLRMQGVLNLITGWNWRGNIQRRCLPIFEYEEGGYIKGHRGRDFGFGKNDWVAIGSITSQNEDYLGGSFYVNEHAEASEDGKTIYNEDESKRSFFEFKRGSLFIFNNNKLIHGTLPVEKILKENRITCSWRIENPEQANQK